MIKFDRKDYDDEILEVKDIPIGIKISIKKGASWWSKALTHEECKKLRSYLDASSSS